MSLSYQNFFRDCVLIRSSKSLIVIETVITAGSKGLSETFFLCNKESVGPDTHCVDIWWLNSFLASSFFPGSLDVTRYENSLFVIPAVLPPVTDGWVKLSHHLARQKQSCFSSWAFHGSLGEFAWKIDSWNFPVITRHSGLLFLCGVWCSRSRD